MVQRKTNHRRHAHPSIGRRSKPRLIVVRMGAPEQVGFTIDPNSSFMDALVSGDIATRTAARAHFTVVQAES